MRTHTLSLSGSLALSFGLWIRRTIIVYYLLAKTPTNWVHILPAVHKRTDAMFSVLPMATLTGICPRQPCVCVCACVHVCEHRFECLLKRNVLRPPRLLYETSKPTHHIIIMKFVSPNQLWHAAHHHFRIRHRYRTAHPESTPSVCQLLA